MSRILLVEDNELSRDMLSRRLTRRGYEVLTAADGAEAVETARTGTPDLILMDMSLPVIDGWEATRRLKAQPDTRGIPIIALTALAMASDERMARDAGCDDFDTKPVDLPRLLEKVERWLGERPSA
jgi:two-component system, cell cycle response regulator DivK